MTREEAIKILVRAQRGLIATALSEYEHKMIEALEMALSALRGPTREQVEKMKGEWTTDGVCSRCGFDAMYYKGVPVQVRTNYCPTCGSPMTDEAVEMVVERSEAIDGETD